MPNLLSRFFSPSQDLAPTEIKNSDLHLDQVSTIKQVPDSNEAQGGEKVAGVTSPPEDVCNPGLPLEIREWMLES